MDKPRHPSYSMLSLRLRAEAETREGNGAMEDRTLDTGEQPKD